MKTSVNIKKLSGAARAVTSKSDMHRALIASALSGGATRIAFTDSSDDILATVDCLRALGAKVTIGDGYAAVEPIRDVPMFSLLDCRESGSTLRFMLPVAAALGGSFAFTGGGRLPQRPLAHLVQALQDNGAEFSGQTLPFTVSGGLFPGTYSFPGNISSQFISGLLMALPILSGDSAIFLTTPLESVAYVDMTLDVLRRYGVEWRKTDTGFLLESPSGYRTPGSYQTECDWSGASYLLVGGALAGNVTVRGLNLRSLQPDRAIFELLVDAGANLSVLGDAVTSSESRLSPLDANVSNHPDLFPTLAVLAAAAEGKSRLSGATRLRYKESDRIHSTSEMLRALGGEVEETEDGIVVTGHGRLRGGVVNSFGDHRIVMAAAIAAAITDGDVVIEGSECVTKSYPAFFDVLAGLGGTVHAV